MTRSTAIAVVGLLIAFCSLGVAIWAQLEAGQANSQDTLRGDAIARKADLDYDIGLVASAKRLSARQLAILARVAALRRQGNLAWEVAQPPRYRAAVATYDHAIRILRTVAKEAQRDGTCPLCADKYQGFRIPSLQPPRPRG